MWRSLSGIPVDDIAAAVRALCQGGVRVVHVGTDSKNRGFHTDFVTVVAVIDPGRGGRVFYLRERGPRQRSLAQRLFREAELSLETAQLLAQGLVGEVVVHVDANEDERHRSSKYAAALSGMVIGYGFRVMIKPNAWCATHVADYVVKEKHRKAA